jgi:hypothetical protein
MSRATQHETVFTVTVDAQEMRVRYRPYHIGGIEPYAILEFSSPHEPRRPIPVSPRGYRSFFAPMHEVEAAPNIEKYACLVALVLGQEITLRFGKPAPNGRAS